jgi:hypothetical protein
MGIYFCEVSQGVTIEQLVTEVLEETWAFLMGKPKLLYHHAAKRNSHGQLPVACNSPLNLKFIK